MRNSKYKNYFTDHYKLSLKEKDIFEYRKWFLSQWKIMKEKIVLRRDSEILEIGSGVGGVYSFLQDSSLTHYEGIEMDQQAVDFTNRYFKTTHFKHVSIEDYTTSRRFDYVFAFEVLEHLHSPFDAIQKIYTLLEKNGVFIGTSPYPFAKNVYADETHIHVLHPENWKRLFLYAGFNNVAVYPMSFFPFLWRLHPSLNIRIPFYVPFSGFIATTLIIAKKS